MAKTNRSTPSVPSTPLSPLEDAELHLRFAESDLRNQYQEILDQVKMISNYMQQKSADIAYRLKELDGERMDDTTDFGRTGIVRLAEYAAHEVLWMVPNMNLDGLITKTSRAQTAAARYAQAQKTLQSIVAALPEMDKSISESES